MQTKLTIYKIRLTDGTNVLLRDFYLANYAVFSSFASKLIPEKEEVLDVIQEVFISFWEHDLEFRDLLAVKAWFYRSIRNSCLDILKHYKVKKKFIGESLEKGESTEFFLDEVLKQEVYSFLYSKINQLPEMEKKVLALALKGHSNAEIADSLGIKVNTVKTHKSRAYKVLRSDLGNLIFLIFPRSAAIEYGSIL